MSDYIFEKFQNLKSKRGTTCKHFGMIGMIGMGHVFEYHNEVYSYVLKQQSRIKELEGAVRELGEGLEFYSDIENHAVIFHVGEGKLATTDKHSGKKAREIITKHKDLIESITKDER